MEAQAVDPRVGVGPRRWLRRPPIQAQDQQGDYRAAPEDVAGIPDEEFRDLDLLRAPLDG